MQKFNFCPKEKQQKRQQTKWTTTKTKTKSKLNKCSFWIINKTDKALFIIIISQWVLLLLTTELQQVSMKQATLATLCCCMHSFGAVSWRCHCCRCCWLTWLACLGLCGVCVMSMPRHVPHSSSEASKRNDDGKKTTAATSWLKEYKESKNKKHYFAVTAAQKTSFGSRPFFMEHSNCTATESFLALFIAFGML